MALTLGEAQSINQNLLHKGIVEEMINESPLVKRLPFVTVTGNAIQINREDASNTGSVGFKAVGDVISGVERAVHPGDGLVDHPDWRL